MQWLAALLLGAAAVAPRAARQAELAPAQRHFSEEVTSASRGEGSFERKGMAERSASFSAVFVRCAGHLAGGVFGA